MENIHKLFKSAVNVDNKHNYKSIIEKVMVSTPEGLSENIPMDVYTLGNMKNPSARNLISQFSEPLDPKQKTVVLILESAKTKCKAIITGNLS